MKGYAAKSIARHFGNSTGGSLIAALLLVAVSAIMGATILFAISTDLQISGNYRRAMEAFYAAEAGIAETTIRLGGSPSTTSGYLGDFSTLMQPNWSAYVVSRPGWKPQEDPGYSTQFTNYLPVPGNLTNTEIVPNSIQTALSYWTKVRHKFEFDAEQAGHSSLTPHYEDLDGVTTDHSTNNQGNLIFYGYALGNELKPTSFTSANPTPYSPIDIITSQSEMDGATSLIQVEVAHPSGPPLLAPMYATSQFIVTGGSANILGYDRCALLAEGRPPVWLGPTGTLVGTPTLSGNPMTAQSGTELLDLSKVLDSLKRGAQIIDGNLVNLTLGSSENPSLLYAERLSELVVQSIKGFGVLLVRGNVRISSPFFWEGLIIVSGQVLFDGGIGTSDLYGALFADRVQVLSGDVTMTLDSCPISTSLRMLPVSILNWQQLL